MLSILIPIYNFNVVDFVKDLRQQALASGIDFEILCLDDNSDQNYKTQNSELKEIKNVVYEELKENIGRSKIRNRLAQTAQYSYLLFLDCDSQTVDDRFINRYVENLSDNKLIYGGRCYEENPPQEENQYFRWWYGVNRETINASQRSKQPYHAFMTNNFLIPKTIFDSIRLDENLQGYGHEDTLFGLELKNRGVLIEHVNNPLCHIGLETFDEYLTKTKEGIQNLKKLIDEKKIDKSVKLYRYYCLLKKIGVTNNILNYFKKNESEILKKLQDKQANLKWFDLYKLGYLISLIKL